MYISQYFAKKRDLSDQSSDGDEPKRLWEESSASSSSPDSPSDMFQESFKNLDKQVKELYVLAQSNNKKHIKGKKQLLNLSILWQKNLMIMRNIGLKRNNG